jgi:ribosomal protein S12 methylthiotransferase accessory factor YcaO
VFSQSLASLLTILEVLLRYATALAFRASNAGDQVRTRVINNRGIVEKLITPLEELAQGFPSATLRAVISGFAKSRSSASRFKSFSRFSRSISSLM